MASKPTKYILNYKGLSIGVHHFDFNITDDFFAAVPESEVKRGRGKIAVDLEKSNSLLKADVRIEGEVEVVCDRCLEKFYEPVRYEGRLWFKFSHELSGPDETTTNTEPNEELWWINPDNGEIDLTEYIYDNIILSLPIQRIHPNDENGVSLCDPDMLARFVQTPEETTGNNE